MLTEVEEKVFRSIVENDYSNGKLDKPVYSDELQDYCDVNPKFIPNIIVNLNRKGLVSYNEHYVWFSPKGINYYNSINLANCA